MTNLAKITILALFLCALYITNTFANPQAPNQQPNQPAYQKVIPPDKLKEDLDFLFKTIEEVHPNMYAYTSEQEFNLLCEKLYESIDHPMNRLEFYKLVAPLVASLKSGHTYIQPFAQELKKFTESGGSVFPLALRSDGSKIILTKNYTSTPLPVGKTVLNINGQPAAELFAKFARLFPAERKNTNPDVVERTEIFGWLLHLEYGPIESWTLEIKETNSLVNSYTVKPVPLEKIIGAKAGPNNEKEKNYYQHLSEYDTALLEINSFGTNLGTFKNFLRESFQKIRDNKTPNLIIDIRENSGGSDMNANALLEYLAQKPYKQFEQAQIKISPQAQKGIGPLRRQNPELFENKKVGDIITLDLPLKTPAANPLRFKGRTFVLIGERSFSTSTSFAATVKHFRIGILVGEETGDPTIVYGNVIDTTLPNSGLTAAVPGRAFVLAGGKPDGRGVIPDYEVRQKPEDITKGRDTVLEFTLNLIRNSGTMSDIQPVD
jgi:hypothetical protein